MQDIHGKPVKISLEYILVLTAFTSGAVDITSFKMLGGVFASAMTGNLAFLGLYLASGKLIAALSSAIALAGFIIGAAAGNVGTRGCQRDAALNRLLFGETLLLAAAAALWVLMPHGAGSAGSDTLIVLLAIAMGAQSIIGKKISLSNIPTVVFTSTLTNIVIGLTDMFGRGRAFRFGRDTKRQSLSFFLYLFGAFAAGLMIRFKIPLVIVLPLLATAAAAAVHAALPAAEA